MSERSEYMRWMRAQRPMVPLIDRFWAKVEPEPNSGCWLWTGATTSGYGVIGRGTRADRLILGHRFSYATFRGEVPEGLELDHLCRVRRCVNPWHLETVTRRVNMLRGDHPYAVAIRTGRCRRGHDLTVDRAYYHFRSGARRCRRCVLDEQRTARLTKATA